MSSLSVLIAVMFYFSESGDRLDVSGAFLQGIKLANARLLRANFNSADLRDSDFHLANFADADLKSANFRGSNLSKANFHRADLSGSDLGEADLTEANLAGANLDDADLSGANLAGLQWREIASAKNAAIDGVKNAPPGFVEWAMQREPWPIQMLRQSSSKSVSRSNFIHLNRAISNP
jgi:uncharacterized protein YjbI with pentapeptide repeats